MGNTCRQSKYSYNGLGMAKVKVMHGQRESKGKLNRMESQEFPQRFFLTNASSWLGSTRHTEADVFPLAEGRQCKSKISRRDWASPHHLLMKIIFRDTAKSKGTDGFSTCRFKTTQRGQTETTTVSVTPSNVDDDLFPVAALYERAGSIGRSYLDEGFDFHESTNSFFKDLSHKSQLKFKELTPECNLTKAIDNEDLGQNPLVLPTFFPNSPNRIPYGITVTPTGATGSTKGSEEECYLLTHKESESSGDGESIKREEEEQSSDMMKTTPSIHLTTHCSMKKLFLPHTAYRSSSLPLHIKLRRRTAFKTRVRCSSKRLSKGSYRFSRSSIASSLNERHKTTANQLNPWNKRFQEKKTGTLSVGNKLHIKSWCIQEPLLCSNKNDQVTSDNASGKLSDGEGCLGCSRTEHSEMTYQFAATNEFRKLFYHKSQNSNHTFNPISQSSSLSLSLTPTQDLLDQPKSASTCFKPKLDLTKVHELQGFNESDELIKSRTERPKAVRKLPTIQNSLATTRLR